MRERSLGLTFVNVPVAGNEQTILMSCLVVYFSWTGKTAGVAAVLAELLSADIMEIKETTRRSGAWGYMRAVWESFARLAPPIEAGANHPAEYDLVIVGFPVWTQKMASPMRSFLKRDGGRVKKLAAFCTLGGAGSEKAFAETVDLCGMVPIATVAFTERQLASGEWENALKEFAERVRPAIGSRHGTSE